jgi:hypothetical protein
LNLDEIKKIQIDEFYEINFNKINKEELINDFKIKIISNIDKNKNNICEKLREIRPIELAKDNDENFHINFILAFSNLRANILKVGLIIL